MNKALVLLHALTAALLLGVSALPTPCPECAPYRRAEFTIRRFHFPVNGPEIKEMAADARGSVWYVLSGPTFGTRAGRIDPSGSKHDVSDLPGVKSSAISADGRFCVAVGATRVQCIPHGSYSITGADSGTPEMQFDRNGTLWLLQSGELYSFDRRGSNGALLRTPAKVNQFLQSWNSAFVVLENGDLGELRTQTAKAGLVYRFVLRSTEPWATSGWPAGASRDGSQWKTDFDGIYHRHPDGTVHSFRFRPHVLSIDQRYRFVPLAIAPDGAAWTMAYGRVCRIDLSDDMRCADAPHFANRTPIDVPEGFAYRFAADGSLWYKYRHEIVRLQLMDHIRPQAGIRGDFAIANAGADAVQHDSRTTERLRSVISMVYVNHRLLTIEVDNGGRRWVAQYNSDMSDAHNLYRYKAEPCAIGISHDGHPRFAGCSDGIWNEDFYEKTDLPDLGHVVAMASLPRHNPWFVERFRENGSWHDMLIEMDDAGVQIGHRLLTRPAEHMSAGADNNLYLRLENGSLFRVNDGVYKRVAGNVPQSFAADKNGAVWIPGSDSLIEIKDGRRIEHCVGARHKSTSAPAIANDGTVWFGYGAALCRRAVSTSCVDLDPGMALRQIVFGDGNDVWFLSDDATIGRYRPSGDSEPQ